MGTLTSRLADINQALDQACADAQRSREDVTLVAVSKRQPDALVLEAYECGVRDFRREHPPRLRSPASLGERPRAQRYPLALYRPNSVQEGKGALGSGLRHPYTRPREIVEVGRWGAGPSPSSAGPSECW